MSRTSVSGSLCKRQTNTIFHEYGLEVYLEVLIWSIEEFKPMFSNIFAIYVGKHKTCRIL